MCVNFRSSLSHRIAYSGPLHCIVGQKKYSEALYNASVLAFQAMPLAAIVNKQFFCVHGGLSPELQTIEDLQKVHLASPFPSGKDIDELADCGRQVHRLCEPGSSGIICDILWSDPAKNWRLGAPPYQTNPTRGCSYVYGSVPLRSFDVGAEYGLTDTKPSRCSLIGTISS